MAADDLLEEQGLRLAYIDQRLPRFRLGEKHDKINRMAGSHGDAYLGFMLGAPDSRPVSRPGIDDDEGTLLGIDIKALIRNYPQEA